MKKGEPEYIEAQRAYMREYMRRYRAGFYEGITGRWTVTRLTEPWSKFHARKKAEREAAKRETNGPLDRGTD